MRDVLLQILEAIKALGPAESTPEEPAAEETTPEVTESVNPAKIAEEPITKTTVKKRSVTK